MSSAAEDTLCSCYGCTIERQRAGLPSPDRSTEPCTPVDACVRDENCWTHSEWVDTSRCDPPNACISRMRCVAHGGSAR